MVILLKKLVDPESENYPYYVFYEHGYLSQPILLLDQAQFDAINAAFVKEVRHEPSD